MKRLFAASTAALMVFALSGTALAAPASKYILSGAVVEDPAGTFTIGTPTTDGTGAFWLKAKSNSGKAAALDLSFVATTDETTPTDINGGAPRLSIPIDTSGDSTREGYAFIDVAGCTPAANQDTTVGTQEQNCAVNALGIDYANWFAFLAAVPTARVAPANTPFIIADIPGYYVITEVHLR